MDLVDEQDIVWLQVGELRRKISGFLDHRPRCGTKARAHLAGHDLRQRRLAEPGRTVEQHVVQRLAAGLGRSDEDFQILADLLLADEVFKSLRAQGEFSRVLFGALGRDQAIGRAGHRASSCRPARITASSLASAPSRWLARATAPKASTRR